VTAEGGSGCRAAAWGGAGVGGGARCRAQLGEVPESGGGDGQREGDGGTGKQSRGAAMEAYQKISVA
jgi:hypothetical protein